MGPKVSIIIPVYRTAEWLPKCMETCLGQTYENIEVILIEDGSPDNCGELCDQYAEADARVIAIHQENGGPSSARNTGLNAASGEFILFVDSDDWIEPDMVRSMVEAQLAGSYDIVVCGYRYFAPQRCGEQVPAKKELFNQVDVFSDLLSDRTNLLYWGYMWTNLYKKSIIDAFSIRFDLSWMSRQDNLFVWAYVEHVKSCFYLDRAFYNYRLVTYDKMYRYRQDEVEYRWKQSLDIFNHFKDLFLNTGTYARFKEKVDIRLLKEIKPVLDNAIIYHSPKKIAISQISSFSTSDLYGDLIALHLANARGFSEKAILICCRYKLWNLLYLCFKLKALAVRVYHKLLGIAD